MSSIFFNQLNYMNNEFSYIISFDDKFSLDIFSLKNIDIVNFEMKFNSLKNNILKSEFNKMIEIESELFDDVSEKNYFLKIRFFNGNIKSFIDIRYKLSSGLISLDYCFNFYNDGKYFFYDFENQYIGFSDLNNVSNDHSFLSVSEIFKDDYKIEQIISYVYFTMFKIQNKKQNFNFCITISNNLPRIMVRGLDFLDDEYLIEEENQRQSLLLLKDIISLNTEY